MSVIEQTVLIGSCAVIFLSSLVLLVSNKYREGVLGHAGLVLLWFSSALMLVELLLFDMDIEPLPDSLMAYTGAAFLMGHLAVRHVLCLRGGRRIVDADRRQDTIAQRVLGQA